MKKKLLLVFLLLHNIVLGELHVRSLNELNYCLACLQKYPQSTKEVLRHSRGQTEAENFSSKSSDLRTMVYKVSPTTQYLINNICILKALRHLFHWKTIIFMDQYTEEKAIENIQQHCPYLFGQLSIKTFNTSSTSMSILQNDLLQVAPVDTFMVLVTLLSLELTNSVLLMAQSLQLNTFQYTWVFTSDDIMNVGLDLVPKKSIFIVPTDKKSIENNIINSQMLNNKCSSLCQHVEQNTSVASLYAINTNYRWELIGDFKSSNNGIETGKNGNEYVLESSQTFTKLFPISQRDINLKVVTIIDPPFTMIESESIDNECDIGHLCVVYEKQNNIEVEVQKCCIGFCIDLLQQVEEDLNLKVDLYIVRDSVYGDMVNETWVGMVGEVVNNNADLIFAALTINAQRSNVIDYTGPYMVGGVAIATMVEKSLLPFINFEAFKPLSERMWLLTFLTMIISSLLILGTEFCIESCLKLQRYSFRQSLLYVGGLLFQRSIGGEEPAYLGSRFISLTIASAMLVIMTSYTAVMTANKVTHKTSLPITGFNDPKIVNPTSSFTYGTIANSAFTRMFRESSDPEWNRMYHFMKSYNFKDTNQAIEDLKSGRLNAVIHDYPVLFHFLSKDPGCKIRFAGEPIKDAGYGLAVKKGNPLRDRLSELIIHYQDTGTITFLKNRWMSSKCEDSLNIQMSAQQMGTTFFGGLFLFVASGICLSVCLFLTECISAAGKRSRGKDTLSGPRTIINHNIINRTLTSIPEETFEGDEDGLAPRSLALDHFRKAVNKEMKSRQEDGHLVLGNSLAEGNINHSFIIE